MAVSVVAGDTTAQPNHVADAEILLEDLLQIPSAEPWIALLFLREQTFFGSQHGAATVHVDAAALQHYAVDLPILDNCRKKLLELQEFADVIGKKIVVLPVRVLRPAVKSPVGSCELLPVTYKDRPRVARPNAVSGPPMEANGRRESA